MDKGEFAQKVIILRGALGLTQEEFAAKMNVSKRSVSAWENGDVVPKKTVRINMAVICGMPVSEFLLEEEKNPVSSAASQTQVTNDEFLLRFLNAREKNQ